MEHDNHDEEIIKIVNNVLNDIIKLRDTERSINGEDFMELSKAKSAIENMRDSYAGRNSICPTHSEHLARRTNDGKEEYVCIKCELEALQLV